ncbi:FAD-binding domain-containing protein [Gymnopus androsaceus JB14]|uniref:FAD-binding domain-containing protein n=1 Tax=Gymnopus androsaceus JB14 TaxID=1447944 RepID=A0A6A4HIQ0_9AGAR|nr:FAD-binding domain-containing protein [Gymnopus androsaceus JB14]
MLSLRLSSVLCCLTALVSIAQVQASGLSTNASTSTTPSAQTCLQLQLTLGPSIVQSRSFGPHYTIGVNSAWNAFNTEVNFQPACVVFATKAEHVQIAMKAIFDNNLDYAVQAGGHSAMRGWNNVEGGVLISFIFMNETSYDAEKDTITLLPGIHWGDAVSNLAPFGVAPVGGRVNDVGTGLLLGGGMSFLSPSFGYAADTFVSLDVVLVNGTLVTATAHNEYADLFRALKGGANRFGIVTKYEVQAAHTGTAEDKHWWGGVATYPNSSSEALLEAVAHYAKEANDTNAAFLIYFDLGIGDDSSISPVIEVAMFYNGSSESFNKTFAELLSIPFTTLPLGPLSYSEISNDLLDPAVTVGQTFSASVLAGMSGSFTSSNPYMETFRLFNNFTTTYASSGQISGAILAFTPVIEAQIRIGLAKGGNAISPPLGDGGFNSILLQLSFSEGVTDIPPAIEQGREYFLENVPNTPGLPLYINECDSKQRVYETYGGFEFLKTVYAKYDPTRFNVRHTQGPLGL